MSKWTDVRDNIVDALNVDVVTDDLKNQVTNTLLEQVLPIIENAVDDFSEKVKSQAPQESGWCRVRDKARPHVVIKKLIISSYCLQKADTSFEDEALTSPHAVAARGRPGRDGSTLGSLKTAFPSRRGR